MRFKLTDAQEEARRSALLRYEHKIAAIGTLARATDCLPLLVDWMAFIGVGTSGECLCVEHDDRPGTVAPVTDLMELSRLTARVGLVPGLEALTPRRPVRVIRK